MNKLELKEYLKSENKSGYKTRENHIKKNFPELYTEIYNFSISNCSRSFFLLC